MLRSAPRIDQSGTSKSTSAFYAKIILAVHRNGMAIAVLVVIISIQALHIGTGRSVSPATITIKASHTGMVLNVSRAYTIASTRPYGTVLNAFHVQTITETRRTGMEKNALRSAQKTNRIGTDTSAFRAKII